MPRLLLVAVAVQAFACASAPSRPNGTRDVRRVAVNGTEITYAVDGDGPPLVIVHGAWGDYRSFHGAVPALATRHRVIRVSLRLHWPNAWPPSEQEAIASYGIATHVADLAELIQRLGSAKVDVLGHSYGGVVAALLAQRHPHLVRRVVLVEPSLVSMVRGNGEGDSMLAAGAKWRDGLLSRVRAGEDPRAIVRSFYDATPGAYEGFSDVRRATLMDNARTTGPVLVNYWGDVPFTCGDARSIPQRVLLVEGAKTQPLMREVASRLATCLPRSKRVVLEGTGHLIQWDAPEAMATVVDAFLTD